MRTPFALLPKTSSLPGLSDHDPQTRYVRTQMQTETPEPLDFPSGNMGYDRRRDDRRSTFPLHYDDTMTMTRTNSAPIAGPLRTRLMDLGAFRGLWKTTGTAAAQAQTGAEEHAPLRTISRTISRTSSTSDMAAEYDGSIQKSPKDGPGTITITTRDVVELTATRSGSSTGLGATSSNAPLDATNADSRKAKTKKALLAFWKFSITPIGFFVVLYGLNVVAWGGMLFLLMLHAAPAMNHPDNGDADDSPRKVWIEIDSQVLNALFCLTSWGLAPWRFRDLYWLLTWRFHADQTRSRQAIGKLAKRNTSWFRLRECDMLHPASEADQVSDIFQAQTCRSKAAPPTPPWKMDFVVWMMVMNTLLQAGMAFFMWHWSRIPRPAWGVGLFLGLGCFVSIMAGGMCFWEGRKVKRIEGSKTAMPEV